MQRERLLTALRGGTPDQVPVTWELETRAAHAFTGKTGWRAVCDAHRMIGSAIFNLQGVGPHVTCRLGPGYGETCKERRREDGTTERTHTLITPRGSLVERWRVGHLPHDPMLGVRIEHFVKAPADYEILADFVAEQARTAVPDTSVSREAREYVGHDGVVGFWMGEANYLLGDARSAERFVLDLIDRPEVIHRTLEAVDRLKEKELAAFNESNAEVLLLDLCWASTSLLNPALVQEFVLPRVRRLMENIRRDRIVGFFTTGRIRAVLDQLVDLRPDFIQHFDVLGDCDLAEVKRTYGDRICIMGNYNPVVLAHGTLEQARIEARRCLDAAMAGGGYILTTSDEVPADAGLDNMKAVVEYVAEHGRY